MVSSLGSVARHHFVLQDFVEETAEFQVGVDDTSRRRKMRLTKRKTIIAGNEAVLSVREELKCYCRCMQVMLQASFMLDMSRRMHYLF